MMCLTVVLVLVVIARQRTLDHLASEKVRRQILSIQRLGAVVRRLTNQMFKGLEWQNLHIGITISILIPCFVVALFVKCLCVSMTHTLHNSYWFELILQYVPSHYCTIVNNIAAQHVFMLSQLIFFSVSVIRVQSCLTIPCVSFGDLNMSTWSHFLTLSHIVCIVTIITELVQPERRILQISRPMCYF